MTHFEADAAPCRSTGGIISLRVEPREKDLGDFSVRRVLPATEQRSVGPFVFFDHMGPAVFPPGRSIDVRPHPHIGIATITYLFEGEILHRDSLGVVQPVRPGEVNLMTAGRGIVHSERPGEDVDRESYLHGIQSWIALPEDAEEMAPAFAHYSKADLPEWHSNGATLRLIMGELEDYRSPVTTYSRTLYADIFLSADSQLSLHPEEQELALYVAEGLVQIGDETIGAGVMAIIANPAALEISAHEDSRVLLIGGSPLGRRYLYWNFVSTRPERIDSAKTAWRENRFPEVPDDPERIPLPGDD
ncbi:pirin domain protein [Luminiphilus syltensis NOR5-1B]|uniref:Pirin domain protein n=1 Tax=Luminiphilus syltensis NOR5-1B TaxID=565045 RepID=B8KRC1_9GAMM|nr:pirin family protein [Luminiphilus syltensis]EED35302.1 pirin domain protein [Luminiphilus syltensis NOR5-1B]